MKKEIKCVAIGRGATTCLSKLSNKKIANKQCMAIVPWAKFKSSLTTTINVDLVFKISPKSTSKEFMYTATLSFEKEIKRFISNSKHLIIVCGLGSPFGLIALPRIVHIAKQLHIPTTAIVSKPFTWEGKQRTMQAKETLSLIKRTKTKYTMYDMDKLLKRLPSNTPTVKLLAQADKEILGIVHDTLKKFS